MPHIIEVTDLAAPELDVYARLTEAQPDWLLSRLAMYWNSHATDVYIKGESFDHAGGAKAPCLPRFVRREFTSAARGGVQ